MPMAMQIWNMYRARLIGQMMQDYGLTVIPGLQWAEAETFKFCFDGIEKGSVVAISTISLKTEFKDLWIKGVDEMIKRLEPKAILIYGGKIEYDFKDIEVHYYNNKVVDRLNDLERN